MTSTDPHWLAPEELDGWLALAGVIVRLPGALDNQLQRDAQLSHFEYMVLAQLSEAPGRTLRMSQLAELSNGSLSRLSHVVKRLEQRGWVRREPCSEDGRFTNAVLTDDGLAKIVQSAPGHVQAVRDLVVDALTEDELRQLGTIGRRILARIAAAPRP